MLHSFHVYWHTCAVLLTGLNHRKSVGAKLLSVHCRGFRSLAWNFTGRDRPSAHWHHKKRCEFFCTLPHPQSCYVYRKVRESMCWLSLNMEGIKCKVVSSLYSRNLLTIFRVIAVNHGASFGWFLSLVFLYFLLCTHLILPCKKCRWFFPHRIKASSRCVWLSQPHHMDVVSDFGHCNKQGPAAAASAGQVVLL